MVPGMSVVFIEEDETIVWCSEEEPEPTGPQVPPEVWQTRPVDGERAMQAIRAMCGR